MLIFGSRYCSLSADAPCIKAGNACNSDNNVNYMHGALRPPILCRLSHAWSHLAQLSRTHLAGMGLVGLVATFGLGSHLLGLVVTFGLRLQPRIGPCWISGHIWNRLQTRIRTCWICGDIWTNPATMIAPCCFSEHIRIEPASRDSTLWALVGTARLGTKQRSWVRDMNSDVR